MIKQAKNRRLYNEWEAHFDQSAYPMAKGVWTINKGGSATNKYFNFKTAHEEFKEKFGSDINSTLTLEDILFYACDFEGIIKERQRIVFKKCRFVECDFEKSILNNFKFSSCRFQKCSFTLTDMGQSELRNCLYESISVSGNETPLLDCYITNPREFIKAVYLKGDVKTRRMWRPEKDYKLFLETKAKVARSILHALKRQGSESEFYNAVNAHEVAQGESRVTGAFYERKIGQAIFHFLQYNLIRFIGFTNSWGKNPALPILMILGVFFVYSLLYCITGVETNILGALEKSFNVSIIAGYNFALQGVQHGHDRAIIASQFILSLVLYTSFFSTLVGRLSRVK